MPIIIFSALGEERKWCGVGSAFPKREQVNHMQHNSAETR